MSSVGELKALLKQHGLPVSGKKDVLVARLKDAGIETKPAKRPRDTDSSKPIEERIKEWAVMKNADLKISLAEMGCKKKGKKQEMISRLILGRNESNAEELQQAEKYFNNNKKLQACFEWMAANEENQFAQNRCRSNALVFKFWPEKLTSSKDMGKRKGIGKGTLDMIDLVLETGSGNKEKYPDMPIFDDEGNTGGEENGGEEFGGGSADAANKSKGDENHPTPESTLEEQILSVLKLADDQEDGVSLTALALHLNLDEKVVSDSLAKLSDKGEVYTTVDEQTFKAA